MMHVEIISIGEELLSGDTDIVDTNSVFITKALREIGLRVLYKSTVGDNEQRIIDVIKLALSRAELIITTGGLGPTVDDMTRQGVAGAVGRKLEFREELLEDIAGKFAKFGQRMSDNNRSQAMMPEGATAIRNPVGTAPSFIVEDNGRTIISLPGVPREMKYLMENAVIPYLREKVGGSGIIKVRILRTAGIGESLIDEKVGDLEKLSNPVVGLAAHAGQTDIRIAATADTETEADALIAQVEAEVRKRMGSFIYGVEKEPLEHAFVEALRRAGLHIAIVEVGTGSMLRSRIEGQPGGPELVASAEYYGSADMLRASNGANSAVSFKELAEQTAAALHTKIGSGLAVALITDPEGTAISVTDGSETRTRTYAYGGLDVGGPEWASAWGMSMGWHLISKSDPGSQQRP
jgi:nicotinamide-nucleotide amidase